MLSMPAALGYFTGSSQVSRLTTNDSRLKKLILFHFRLHFFGPGVDAATEVVELGKALLLQVLDGMLAADAMVAINGYGHIVWDLLLVGWQIMQGRKQGLAPVAKVADFPFFGLAHIQGSSSL